MIVNDFDDIDDDDDGNAANNAARVEKRQYDQTDDDKEWFNEPQLEALRSSIASFPTAKDALAAARKKYKVSKVFAAKIEGLYEEDKRLDQPPF